jgi:hypothetical protein
MNETRQKLYRAHVHWDYSGPHVFCHYGHLSACGEWVEGGKDTRWRRTADWYETEAAAKASQAGKVAANGAKMLELAVKLLEDAKAVPA